MEADYRDYSIKVERANGEVLKLKAKYEEYEREIEAMSKKV